MEGVKADMCFTDPPYILNYLKGKTRARTAPPSALVRRKTADILETDVLPDNFTELWMANVAKVQKPDFSIIIFENPKEFKNDLERIGKTLEISQYYYLACSQIGCRDSRAKYKFFNKHDIALVGTARQC